MSHKEPDGVIDILQSMVSIDSVNGSMSGDGDAEGKLVDYLAFAAAALGFTIRKLPVWGHGNNLLVLFEGVRGRPWVLFDSHIDTVSIQGMTIDPFGAELRDGRLWGRGACDTKGSGAAMLWALREYALSGGEPNNVGILYSVDEEVSLSGIRSFVANDYPAFVSQNGAPVGVVVGEPTRMQPIVAHNGITRFKVVTRGKSAHAAMPEAGISAISAMVRIVEALESGYIPRLDATHKLTGRARCSVNVIRGGTASNIIPERCEIEVDRRIVPGETPEQVRAGFEAAIREIAGRHSGLAYEVEETVLMPPFVEGEASPIVALARTALRAAGLSADPVGATYGTHAAFLSGAGVPALVLGPGDIAQAHSQEEWIDLGELSRAVDVYQAIMRGRVAPTT